MKNKFKTPIRVSKKHTDKRPPKKDSGEKKPFAHKADLPFKRFPGDKRSSVEKPVVVRKPPVEKKSPAEAFGDSDVLLISGRHEVLNALESGQKIESIYISKGVKGSVPAKARELASAANVPVKELSADIFAKKFGEKTQGIIAIAGAYQYFTLEQVIDIAKKGSRIIVALNQVEDARNLGAIVRTVEASGCSGVIIPKHRSAGMTEWAVRTAQGAAAYLPVARVTNLSDSLKKLKDEGFWVVGLDETADKKFTDMVYSDSVVLVAGGEDVGLGDRVKSSCDHLVSIPLSGKTPSLNVSVSTALVLYEICRQKDFFKKT